MKTSVERVDDTTVKLTVTVEAERVREAMDAAANKLASEVRVPGFRPGKAPRKVLESRLGKDAIAQEAARDALPTFYAEAAQAEELAAVGAPEFDVETFTDNAEAQFTATVEVAPEFEVPDYEGLQVPHPEWEVTDEEIDEQLDELRERFAELETAERPVQVGDHVLITVTGRKDGEVVDDASAEDVLYAVGDPSETESALDREVVGSEAGAVLAFTDTLGDDYGERAGEELEFTAIVKEVKHKRLPDLDDEFALTASEFDTIDELRDEVRRQLAVQKLQQARQALRGRVIEAICEQVEIPLPDSLVEQEARMRLHRLAHQAEQYGMALEQFAQAAGIDPSELMSRIEPEARDAVKAQLVIDAIGRQAEIDVEQDDLGEEITRQAARAGRSPQEIAETLNEPERLQALVGDVFRRKTVDHLVERVQVLSAPPEGLEDELAAQAPEAEEATETPAPDAEEATETPASEAEAAAGAGAEPEPSSDDGEDEAPQ